MSKKNNLNLFDFIDEKEEDIQKSIDQGNIVFVDKVFEEIDIPKIFLPINKKCKKLKDLKYYSTKELQEKIKKNYKSLFQKYINTICKGYNYLKESINNIIISSQGYDVLLLRVQGNRLERIGELKNLSRERIRQIETCACEEIIIFLEAFLEVENLQKKFDKVLFYNIEEIFSFTENKDIIKIIEFVLKKKENYTFAFYSKDFSSFVNSKKKNLLTMINDLISLNEYFNYYETYSKINDILIYKHNILDFTFELYKKYLENKKYIFKGNLAMKLGSFSTNFIMSKYIKEYYPKGIIMDDEGLKKLEKSMSQKYQYEFKLSSVNSKIDEMNPELIIWGKQKRIHIDNVRITEDKLNEIIFSFEKIFEDNNYMLLDDVYTKMQDILQDTEIDDKYKLYGILKYNLRDKYYFKKMAVRKNELKDYTLNQLVYNYINEHELCSIDEIMHALDISLSSLQAIIRDDISLICVNDKYTIASKIKISEDSLERIKIKLEESVQETYIHRENFYNKYADEWKKMGINDSAMLYNLCRFYYTDEYNFFTPYIQNKRYDYAITFKKIILDYFMVNKGIIDIEKAQRDISIISATKDLSLIYQLRNYNIKVFRMGLDRMALLENISFDDINKYQIKKRLNQFFDQNNYALEDDLEKLSKGLYYYLNNEKCYMNSYSLCAYVENNLNNYIVLSSLGINNYLTSKYAITKTIKTYQELIYKIVREKYTQPWVYKSDIQKLIREKKLLPSTPNDLLSDFGKYENDKIYFV